MQKFIISLLLIVGVTTASGADINRIDFDKVGNSSFDSITDNADGQSLQFIRGKVIIAARNEPWGAKTNVFASKDFANTLSGKQWMVESRFRFNSDFLEQQSGIFVGDSSNRIRFVVGRLMVAGSEFSLALFDSEDRQVKVACPTFSASRPIWLRLSRLNGQIWGFYSTNGLDYKQVGYVPVDDKAIFHNAGLCFVDNNPYQMETRIKKGIGYNGTASFEYISTTSKPDEKMLQRIPKVYMRVKLINTNPSNTPLKIGCTIYPAWHERLFRFGIAKSGEVHQLHCKWAPLPWGELDNASAIRAGEVTGWADLSNMYASPLIQSSMAIALWQDYSPVTGRDDDGNVKHFKIRVDFASSPDAKDIVKTIEYSSEGGTLGLYFPPNEGSIKTWGPKIRTMKQYALDRLNVYKRECKNIVNNHSNDGYPISLHLIDGYHATLYDNATKAIDEQIQREFLCVNRPWVSLWPPSSFYPPEADPWGPDYKEKVKNHILATIKDIPAGDFYVKAGDELGIFSIDSVRKSAYGPAAFRMWLSKRVVDPMEIGIKSFDEAFPIDRSQVNDASSAKLYYLTIWFMQETTASSFRKIKDVFHELYGKRAIVGTDVYFGGFPVSPDYFMESKLGVFDQQIHHYGSGDTISPRQTNADMFIADMLRSASDFGTTRPGMLWFVCRIAQKQGTLLSGITALAHGLKYIYFYGYGPLAGGAEWFTDDRYKVDAFVGASEITHLANRYADALLKGKREKARVALLLSRSASIWANTPEDQLVQLFGYDEAKSARNKRNETLSKSVPAEGIGCERRMIHSALQWKNYPADIVPEEEVESGSLDKYSVLYIYEPNLSTKAQAAVIDWVRRGGVLFIGPAAAVRNEYNAPLSLMDNITGEPGCITTVDSEESKEFLHRGSFGEVWETSSSYSEWDTSELKVLDKISANDIYGKPFTFPALAKKESINIKSAKVIAAYTDGKPAIVRIPFGKGTVIKAGTCIGAAYARTASPGFDKYRTHTVPPCSFSHAGTTAYWQRLLDSNIQDLLLYPVRAAGINPAVKCSVRGIDTGLFEKEDGSGALLLLGKYTKQDTSKFSVSVTLKKKYRKLTTYTGKPVSVRWNGDSAVITLNLSDIEAIEFVK
jgi:hypothetical protein